MRLRGGFETDDPRLDRLPQFDRRSLAYLATDGIEARRPRSYTWGVYGRLDQGREGACVGFSITHELLARPVAVVGLGDADARALYRQAQTVDEYPGEAYEGTSVLAGMQTATEMGWYSRYEWAWSVDELALAVGYKGPAVLGVNWYTDMFAPAADGYIHVTGSVAGGHAILCNGVSVRHRRFRLTNSWGRDWGANGQCFISFDDMARLFSEAGEAAVPVERRTLSPRP